MLPLRAKARPASRMAHVALQQASVLLRRIKAPPPPSGRTGMVGGFGSRGLREGQVARSWGRSWERCGIEFKVRAAPRIVGDLSLHFDSCAS